MENLSTFLFSGLLFTCLYLSFRLVGRKAANPRLNRMILLTFPVFSLVLGFWPFETQAPISSIQLPELNFATQANQEALSSSNLFYLYFLPGISLLAFKLYRSIQSILNRKSQARHAFSAFGKVYIGDGFKSSEREMVLAHERAHIRQGHGIDLIISCITEMIFWWNPFAYAWSADLKLIHELEADQGVKQFGLAYKKLLLEQALGEEIHFAHSFSVKKHLSQRLKDFNSNPCIMKKKILFYIPILALMIGFSAQVHGQDKPTFNNTVIEVPAEYPGGQEALFSDLTKNFKYPKKALKKGIEGKVFVQFVVDEEGNVTQGKVVRGVDPILDDYALSLLDNLKQWSPGKQKGENVKIAYTLPINFKLPEE